MTEPDNQTRTAELEQRIARLPAGSVTMKNVNGRTYAYHRWTENRKRREQYVPAAEVEALRARIEERRALERELQELRVRLPAEEPSPAAAAAATVQPVPPAPAFLANVRLGSALHPLLSSVRGLRARTDLKRLAGFVLAKSGGMLLLCGMPGSGCGTLLRQVLLKMNREELARTAFLQVTPGITLADVCRDLETLQSLGTQCVFLNDAAALPDLAEGAAALAGLLPGSGMRLVVSGADPLAARLLAGGALCGRVRILDETFISYHDSKSILGLRNSDEHLRLGGTLRPKEESPFRSVRAFREEALPLLVRRLLSGATALEGLPRDPQVLAGVVRQVLEGEACRFLLEVLDGTFRPAAAEDPADVLERFARDVLRERLADRLRTGADADAAAAASSVRQGLGLLGVTASVEVRHLPDVDVTASRTVFVQPGLLHVLLEDLVGGILLEGTFRALPFGTRTALKEGVLAAARERMLEDLVLLEAREAFRDQEVFRLAFPTGAIDAVVADPAGSCRLIEVRHDAAEGARALADETHLALVAHRWGAVTERTVLHAGGNRGTAGVVLRNLEEWLWNLGVQ